MSADRRFVRTKIHRRAKSKLYAGSLFQTIADMNRVLTMNHEDALFEGNLAKMKDPNREAVFEEKFVEVFRTVCFERSVGALFTAELDGDAIWDFHVFK